MSNSNPHPEERLALEAYMTADNEFKAREVAINCDQHTVLQEIGPHLKRAVQTSAAVAQVYAELAGRRQ
jgi:hypothetical protein